MNILFIGQVVPKKEIDKCSAYSVAGDLMQKNIIKGMSKKEEVSITVASVLPNAAFPRDKFWIGGSVGTYCDMEINNLGYANIPGIKQMSQMRALLHFAASEMKKKKYDYIICYNMYLQFGKAALRLEKKLNIPLVAILADLPVESVDAYRGVNRLLFVPLKRKTMQNIRRVKHAVVLNENVQGYIDKDGDYIVVPGGVDAEKKEPFIYREVREKRIIYAGALSQYSGIMNLITAVNDLDVEDVRLEIYGTGEIKDEVASVSKQSKNINYMGTRPITEMRSIMEGAWILINPRSVEDPVSAVTFPSKIFEYIMCRRPVITTEFSGIPQYIQDITVGCGRGTPIEIQNAIQRILIMEEEELKKFVFNAYEYVTKSMSWDEQTDRIVTFLEVIKGRENENK